MLELMESTRWGRLSRLQIRLTKMALLLADVLAFSLAGVLAAVLVYTFGEVGDEQWLMSQDLQRYWAWLVVVAMGLSSFLVRLRHYSDRKLFWTELGEVLWVLLVLALVDLAVVGVTRWNSSRMWWLLVWLLAALCVPLMRGVFREVMRRIRVWQRPALIVGNGPNAKDAMRALQSDPALGFEVSGFVDVATVLGGESKALLEWTKIPGVQLVLALEPGQSELHDSVLRKLSQWHVEDVSVVPAMRGVPLFGTEITYFFSHEVAWLRLRNNLRYWPARLLKRLVDLIAAFLLVVLLALPFAFIVWLIRRDGGPAIFAHKRVGQSGKLFPCYKFRTMRVDAEEQLRFLLARDPGLLAEWERELKLRNDPRITRIGRFLRRTSLDELPQLINVIRGDMSLVGPRPVIEEELERYGADVDYFLMVRPGITGLWQVSGRSDSGYEARVYLDTWYVKNWSLWYDIAILFKTIKVVFHGKGAY
jgi:Undecaprenyl-phosphate galactose phosphotransferase WbaP